MTPEEREEKLARLQKLQQLRDLRAQRDAPAAPEASQGGLDRARGAVQSFNRGSLLGFGDEIVGAGRAALDYILPDPGAEIADQFLPNRQTPAENYAMYRDDERAVTDQFAEENPGTAVGLNLAGGFLSPVNRVAPGVGRTPTTGLARATAEGAVAGVGEGRGTAEEQLQSAAEGALWGVGTNATLQGLGQAARRTVFGRRVDEDLVQPDGTFKPVHLADPDGLLGVAYRQTLGRIPGTKRVLQEQEQPFVDRVVGEMDAVTKRLDDEAVRIEDDFIAAKQRAEDAAVANTDRVNAVAANDADRIRDAAAMKADQEARQFRRTAATEAFPEHARGTLNGVDIDNPLAVRQALAGWWNNQGFNEVKRNTFDWSGKVDKGLKRDLRQMFSDDPDLALSVGDAVGNIGGMVDRLRRSYVSQGRDLAPEDLLQELIDPEIVAIDGEALMAIRNQIAMGANTGGKNRGSVRQIVNKIDDFIRNQLSEDEVSQFNDQIERYTTALSYMDATRSKAARAAGGNFTPSQWMQASGKYGGRGMSAKAAPLESTARSRLQRAEAAQQAAKDLIPSTREQAVQSRRAIARRKQDEVRSLRKARREAEQRVAQERKRGALAEAKERVKELQRLTVPDTASGLSQLLTAGVVGDVIPAPTTNRAVQVARGMALGRGLATEGVQKALAGQTNWQTAARNALMRGDLAEYNRILARFAAGQATGGY